MTTIDELAAKVAELTAIVSSMQRTLNPVDASGLPVPTRYRDVPDPHMRNALDGPRWQIGNWTVLAIDDDPDGDDCVYFRDPYNQNTGDIEAMSHAEAIQFAGALLAAVRYKAARVAGIRTVGV